MKLVELRGQSLSQGPTASKEAQQNEPQAGEGGVDAFSRGSLSVG